MGLVPSMQFLRHQWDRCINLGHRVSMEIPIYPRDINLTYTDAFAHGVHQQGSSLRIFSPVGIVNGSFICITSCKEVCIWQKLSSFSMGEPFLHTPTHTLLSCLFLLLSWLVHFSFCSPTLFVHFFYFLFLFFTLVVKWSVIFLIAVQST